MSKFSIDIDTHEFARYLDTSIIKPDATSEEVISFLKRCKEYPFAGIGVDLCYTSLAAKYLSDTDIDVVTTIAYPLGALTTDVKVFHIKLAREKGTDEIDVGMDIGAIKSKQYSQVEKDISSVVKAAGDITVKIVIACSNMEEEEIVDACKIICNAGAEFVKTNPGFGLSTELEHVKLIRDNFSPAELKIMPAGGVRTKRDALEFLKAGSDRVATSYPFHVLGIMNVNN